MTEELLSLIASPEMLNCVYKTGEGEEDNEMFLTEIIELDEILSTFILQNSEAMNEEEENDE
jgi:hypothetical protein